MEQEALNLIGNDVKGIGIGGAVFLAFIYVLKGLVSMMLSSITNREQTIQTFFGQAVASLQKATEQNLELQELLGGLKDAIKTHTEVLKTMQEDAKTQSATHKTELAEAVSTRLEPLLKFIQDKKIEQQNEPKP